MLFINRLVSCGAMPTTDHDLELAHLIFDDGETYLQFFARVQQLQNEYEYQNTANPFNTPY